MVRKQVFIEALIMEVSSEASFSFGINWAIGGNTGDAAIVGGVSLNGGAVSLSSSGANKTVSLPAGVSIGAILKDAITVGNTSYNIQSILNAVRGNSDVDVLATPQLLTLDNEEASVEVVDNIPFTKESTTRNDNDFTTQSMDYKDVGVKLKITPRISDDGSLRLEVEQEVSRVTQGLITLTNGDLPPVRLHRPAGGHRRPARRSEDLQPERSPRARQHPRARLAVQIPQQEVDPDQPVHLHHAQGHQKRGRLRRPYPRKTARTA